MSKSAVAVMFADSHLQERVWLGRPILGDAFHSFSQIVDYAIAHDIRELVGAGDLLDRTYNSSPTVVFLAKQLARLEHANVRLNYIQGQHEYHKTPWMSLGGLTESISGKTIKLGSMRCYGLDFQATDQLVEALTAVPKGTDVFVGHQTWTDFMGDRGQVGLANVPHAKLAFTGDYHETQELKIVGRSNQTMRVLSPGSTCMQSIDETADKYFFVLHDDGTTASVQLRTRLIIRVTLTDSNSLNDCIRDLPEQLAKLVAADLPQDLQMPLVRITYPRALTDTQVELSRLLRGRAHVFWKEVREEREEVVLARDQDTSQLTLASALPEYLRARKMEGMLSDCQRLLTAVDVQQELARMRDESLGGN